MYTNPETAIPRVTDLTSLNKLLALNPDRIYPGHGPHIGDQASAIGKIKEYIEHRLERERQIIQAMERLTQQSTSVEKGITVRQIVEVLYAGLGVGVYIAAEKPVGAHLRKLEQEGKVRRSPDGKWILLSAVATT
jgi:ribonuclease/clavin/mitogillin